jgi:hypothetical protein
MLQPETLISPSWKRDEVMEEDRVLTVKIKKLKDRYAVTIDGGEGILVDEDYYQPRTSEEVGKLIEMWLNGFDG